MAEQRSSVHIVLILGLVGVGFVMLMMMVSMEGLQKSAAGTRAKLVIAVSDKYKPETAFAEFRSGDGGTRVLYLSYTTRELKPRDAWEDEMRDVAEFLHEQSLKYEDRELYETRRIDVFRTQVSGDGCFRSVDESRFSLDLPQRVKTKPPKPGLEPPVPKEAEETPK